MDKTSRNKSSLSVAKAIPMINRTAELCFTNNFIQAKKELEPWVDQSMYHALAYSGIMCIQALLKFEQQAIQTAAKSIKDSLNLCQRHRKKPRWSETLSNWIWKPTYDNLTEEEKHAELCYAECLLLDSLITFIQDENVLSFVWGAFKVRSSYQSYKICLDMVVNQPFASAHTLETNEFEGGTHFGIGGFNLVLSLLPPIIIKLLEWVGFSGDRFLGISHLEKGSKCQSLRSPLCSLVLLAYHVWITQYLGNGDGDVQASEEILQPLLSAFPKGSVFLFFDGRLKHVHGKLDEAINRYKHSITVQSDIRQLHHFFYWELMWCYAFKGDWFEAYRYASILFNESLWSRTVYMHLKASFKVMDRLVNQKETMGQDEEEQDREDYMFRRLPDFKQRIGGQSLPIEDFAIHKAKKYFDKNGCLFLPGLELVYIWNGFKVLNNRPDLVKPIKELVEHSLRQLKLTKDQKSYADDLCLGRLLLGMCYRCLDQKAEALECLRSAYSQSKYLKDDLYLEPYTCAEMGFLCLDDGDFDMAKEYLERARKHRDHLLRSLLHLRIHGALQKMEHADIEKGRTRSLNNKVFQIKQGLAEDGDNISFSGSEDDFFDAVDDCSKLLRQDSNSSFDVISDDELDFL